MGAINYLKMLNEVSRHINMDANTKVDKFETIKVEGFLTGSFETVGNEVVHED